MYVATQQPLTSKQEVQPTGMTRMVMTNMLLASLYNKEQCQQEELHQNDVWW